MDSTSGIKSDSRAWGLDHQFDSVDQQRESSFLGMWLFLVTEIMFFGLRYRLLKEQQNHLLETINLCLYRHL